MSAVPAQDEALSGDYPALLATPGPGAKLAALGPLRHSRPVPPSVAVLLGADKGRESEVSTPSRRGKRKDFKDFFDFRWDDRALSNPIAHGPCRGRAMSEANKPAGTQTQRTLLSAFLLVTFL